METRTVSKWLKWFVLLALIAMLTVNALSSILPINGVTPKEVSDRYPNLFVPAPLTFAIWGVIYLLVIAYTLYQFGLFRKKGEAVNADSCSTKPAFVFIVSSVLNLSWVIAWHYGLLALSFVILALFLFTMIDIATDHPRAGAARHKRKVVCPPAVFGLFRLGHGRDHRGGHGAACRL